MYKVGIGDIVFIKQDIIEHANECHPASGLACRGDVVVIRKESSIKTNESWLVSHPSRTDNCFRVSRDEIMVHDPLITHNEKEEYKRKHNMADLDLRFLE